MTITTICFIDNDSRMLSMVQDSFDLEDCIEYNDLELNGAANTVELYDNSQGLMELVDVLKLKRGE